LRVESVAKTVILQPSVQVKSKDIAPILKMPDDCMCPLSLEVMVDPVMAADGHTYERSAIEPWLANHNTSPLTTQLLESKDLKTNIALRNTIAALKAAGFT
jgi:hypothetical protein